MLSILAGERKRLVQQRQAALNKTDSAFNAKHQQSNNEIHAEINQRLVSGIWTSADDVYRNRSVIGKDLKARIDRNVAALPLRISDFALSALRVDVLGQKKDLSKESILELAKSLQKTGQFDEDFYLASYADVANAVMGGHFKDGEDHFKAFGDNEGRNGWFSDGRYDFDEAYYLTENPDVAQAIINGEYRSGAHHFWSTGRADGLKKNENNDELLRAINLDAAPYEKAEQLPTQTRQTTDGEFTLGFRSKGSRVENHLEGLFSGDIYPDAYLDIHDAANKMDPASRSAVKDATKPLVDLSRALEASAGKAITDKSAVPTFVENSEAVADGLAGVAEQIAGHRIATEQAEQIAEQAEIEFLREFRENWQKQKADEGDSLSKPDLFKAVQDANKALGQDKPNSTLLKGLRDILEDDSKPKS
jgi:hypothetical protein